MKELNYEHSESYDCFVNNNGIGIDLLVYESGYERCDPFHCWGPDKKQYHVFHYVLSGRGKLYIDDKCYECGAGDLFYLSPNVVSYYEADGGDPWEYKWVGFNGMRAEALVTNTRFSDDDPIVRGADGPAVEALLDNVFVSFKSDKTPNLLSVGHLYLFLAWLTQNYPARRMSEEDVNEQRFFNMLRFIQLKYTTKIKVSDMAAALGYDRTYIYKMFMKYLRMSPSDYIEGLKLKLACELMRSKKFTLTEIAGKVGYDNYNWIFTVFKRSCGMSPQEYLELPEFERLDRLDGRLKLIDDMLERYHEYVRDGKLL